MAAMNLQRQHALISGLYVLLLMLTQGCSGQPPSQNDAVNATCEKNKPHKCPPYSTCYGPFQYCSKYSKTVEPCVNETVVTNLNVRKKLCQDITQGLNITKLIRHESCQVERDCRAEFTALSLTSAQDDDDSWTWILPTSLAGLFAIVIIVIGVLIWYYRKRAKGNRLDKEETVRMIANNNGNSVDIVRNNRMNENREEGDNQTQQSTDPELGDTNNTETMALVRGDSNAAGNAHNSPDSGITRDSTTVTINEDSSSGSGSNRNSSTHSSGNSSASIGSEPQEEYQRRPAPNGTQYDDHPAAIESRQDRSIHHPTSEPQGRAQLVTNQTKYDGTNNGGLE